MSSPGMRWAGRVGAAVATWLVVLLAARILEAELRVWVLAALVLAAAGVTWLALDLSGSVASASWRQVRTDPVRPPGEDRRLDTLRRRLDRTLDGTDPEHQLYADVAAVADERLMARHGVSRLADPERAAGVLGPDLTRLLSGHPPARLSADELDRILTRIEAL